MGTGQSAPRVSDHSKVGAWLLVLNKQVGWAARLYSRGPALPSHAGQDVKWACLTVLGFHHSRGP